MRYLLRTALMLVVTVFALSMLQPAYAKDHRGVYDDLDGVYAIKIAPMEHGQLVVMAERRREILAMAKAYAADPIVAKLVEREFGQFLRAGAGLIRADLADANTVLHLPTHAYLAHDRAILIRMRDISPIGSEARTLADDIDMQLMQQPEPSSLSLCQYSTLSFDTNSYVGPDWQHLDHQRLAQLALGLAIASMVFMGVVRPLLKVRRQERRAIA